MNELEYKEKLREHINLFNNMVDSLNMEYVLSNAKYGVGDIIKDSRWTIKIDKITYSTPLGNNKSTPPVIVYYGYILKRDLTPTKKKERGSCYGDTNIVLVKSGK